MTTTREAPATPAGERFLEPSPADLAQAEAEVTPWFVYNDATNPTIVELARLAALWRARAIMEETT